MFNRKLLRTTVEDEFFLLNKKKIITPADLPCGHGDGVIESGAAGCGEAAFLFIANPIDTIRCLFCKIRKLQTSSGFVC